MHPELAPISGINPLFKYVSPPRQVMVGGNLTQTNVVSGSTRKRLRSGLEREHAKGTFKHMFDRDVVIRDVIPRYKGDVLHNRYAQNPMDLVIYEDYETKQLGCIELHKFHVMHQHFGFNYKFKDEITDKIVPGMRFEAGTIIADSPNVTTDGDYKFGLETIACFITDPAVSEDGIVISEPYAGRIGAQGFEKRTFSCGRSHYPINLNGNSEVYKAIPDIGDTIRSNGMIAAFRPFDATLDPIYMTGRKLMEPAYGMDVPLYGIAGARIVDVKVLHNEHASSSNRGLPDVFTAQLRKYYEAEKEFYMRVIKTCIVRAGRLMHDVDLHPDLWKVLYEGIQYCGTELAKSGLWPMDDIDRLKRQRVYRNEMLDEWHVDITFAYTTEVAEGPKLTNLHGAKGVAVAVWPEDCMPVDKFGNRAEVIMFAGSTVARMVLAQMHEPVLGATGRDVIKRIRRKFMIGDFEKVNFDDVLSMIGAQPTLAKDMFNYLLGFYEIVSTDTDYPKVREYVNQGDRWLRHLAHVIEDGNEPHGIYFHHPSDSTVKMSDVVNKINGSEYMPEISTITYKWPTDTEYTTTHSEVLIAPTYFLPLEKMATDWSGVSSSRVGHFGTTSRLTQSDKYSRPGRETSTRTIGEDEARNLTKSVGGDHVADIMDMNNNPLVHKEVCYSILTADKPTNIERAIDRKTYPVGGHRPLAYIHHSQYCSGKEFLRPNDEDA